MRIGFVTIYNADLENSIPFWSGVMGFRVVRDFPGGPGRRIVFLEDGPCQLELIGEASPGPSAPPCRPGDVAMGFRVADLEAEAARLRAKGVELATPPTTMPSGTRLLKFRDPNGVELTFVEEGRA